jgi:hypothetical protein
MGVFALDGLVGVDVAGVVVVGDSAKDPADTDGNIVKTALWKLSSGTLPAFITFISSRKSGTENGYSPLMS